MEKIVFYLSTWLSSVIDCGLRWISVFTWMRSLSQAYQFVLSEMPKSPLKRFINTSVYFDFVTFEILPELWLSICLIFSKLCIHFYKWRMVVFFFFSQNGEIEWEVICFSEASMSWILVIKPLMKYATW